VDRHSSCGSVHGQAGFKDIFSCPFLICYYTPRASGSYRLCPILTPFVFPTFVRHLKFTDPEAFPGSPLFLSWVASSAFFVSALKHNFPFFFSKPDALNTLYPTIPPLTFLFSYSVRDPAPQFLAWLFQNFFNLLVDAPNPTIDFSIKSRSALPDLDQLPLNKYADFSSPWFER